MTPIDTTKPIQNVADVIAFKNSIADGAKENIVAIRSDFRAAREFEFDEFLYGFDPTAMGFGSVSETCAVAVLHPNLMRLYGRDPVYLGYFDRDQYDEFIEQQLKENIADKLALVSDEVVWLSGGLNWIAYGSRPLDRVILGVGRT